jgi:mono/diheme cytochrome c family protein
MMKLLTATAGVIAVIAFSHSASAQSADKSIGRRLAETTCSACHQIDASATPRNPNSGAPSFVAVSHVANELAIKVFLRTSHPTMPNIMLSPEEIDSVAAYIVGLAKD